MWKVLTLKMVLGSTADRSGPLMSVFLKEPRDRALEIHDTKLGLALISGIGIKPPTDRIAVKKKPQPRMRPGRIRRTPPHIS